MRQVFSSIVRLWEPCYTQDMVFINCPEGMIKLPIDLWYCKIVDEACPLQSSIDTEDWPKFHSHCLAPKKRQDEIQLAITSGKYSGFHHMPGRYLCPTCRSSRKGHWERAYHYPWDLRPLLAFVPFDEETLRLEIIRRGIPSSSQFSHLCRNCIDDILGKLGLPSVEDQSNQYHGYGEPLNMNEPVAFCLYRSIREREDSGSVFDGSCLWCGNSFNWNDRGKSVCYTVMPEGHNHFDLCESCGDHLVKLFQIE